MREVYLPVKSYYSESQYSCIDLAIANSLTYIDETYYDIYCALSGIYMNWGAKDNSKTLLEQLGIKETALKCTTNMLFINTICGQLEKGIPVVMTPLANTIFYSFFYKKEDYHGGHGLIIYGYDTEREIFLIKENIHVTEYNKVSTKGTPFYTYAITFSQLYEIYKESVEKLNHAPILFIYEKESNQRILSPYDILNIFVNINLEENNLFAERIAELSKENYFKTQDETAPIYIRRGYINSLQAFINVLKQYIENLPISISEKEIYQEQITFFAKEREILVCLMIKHIMKKQSSKEQMNAILTRTLDNDMQLQRNVREILKINTDIEKVQDFALGCMVTADSFRTFPQNYPPENAVNGKCSSGAEEECWFSTTFSSDHWIQFDLMQICEVKKIVIRHYEGKYGGGQLTDFSIQISKDGICYQEIISVKNNQDVINEYSFDGIVCRWIKLTITGTADIDGFAALCEFEAWG